jgi:O-antigen/teichoic acid export membrane protein
MAGRTSVIGRLRSTGDTRVRRATLGTVATAFVGQAVLVVSGVIVARMLGPENRGYLALMVLVPIVVAQAGSLGMPLALTYHIARERTAAAGIWAGVRPFVLVQGGLLTGIHCIVLWALLRDEPAYVADAAVVTVALVPAQLAQMYGLAILQGRERFLAFNVLRTAPAAVYAALVAGFLVLDVKGLDEVAYAWTAANVGIGLVTIATGLRGLGPVVEGVGVPAVTSMLSFGVRGLLGASSPIEYYRLDQAVVGLFLAPVSLGIYTVAIAFTNLPRFVSTSVGMVAYPAVASEPDRREGYRRLKRFFAVTLLACVAIVGTLEVAAGWLVPFFFGHAFEDAVPIVRIVLISSFLIAMRRILSDGARGLGLPGLGTVGEVVSLVALAPALAIFLPLWGTEGVAFALVIAGLVSLPVVVLGLRSAAARDFRPAFGRGPLSDRARRAALALGGGVAGALFVLLADAAAVGLTLVDTRLAAAVAALVLFCLGVSAVRRRLGSSAEVPSAPAPVHEPEPDAEGGLAAARALYYLGLALLGLLVLRPAAGLTLSDLIFLGAFGLTLAVMAATGREGPGLLGPVMMLGVVLFAVGGLVSTFGADNPGESITVVARVVYLTVVWFWLGSALLTRLDHVRTAMAFWVASAALGGAGAIAQTILGDVIPGGLVHYGRVSGFTYDVNDLGGLCGVAAVPATMLLASARTGAGRLAALGALLLIVAGLLLSGSVTGVGAAVAGGVVWLAIVRPPLRLVVPVVAAVALFSVFAASSNRYWESPLERFTTSSRQSGTADSTLFTRFDSYEAAWSTIEGSPLVGIGLAREAPKTETGLGVHNMFLGTWYQAGFVALAGLVLLVVAALSMGWRAVAQAQTAEERRIGAALLGAVVAFIVFGQAQEVLFQRYGWVSVALLAALRTQQRAREAAAAEPEPAPRRGGFAVPATSW